MVESLDLSGAVLAVRVRGGEYGLPVGQVGEVLRVPRITRVPLTSAEVRGVVGIRGEVVAVVDLATRLGGDPVRADADRARLVTVTVGDEPLALLVEGVAGLVDVRGVAMAPPPPEVVAELPPGALRGMVAGEEGRTIMLLDLERVLQPGGPAEDALSSE